MKVIQSKDPEVYACAHAYLADALHCYMLEVIIIGIPIFPL